MKTYWVYVMTNYSRTLYTGMTNNLPRRVTEHREGTVDSFTKRYNVTQLVYYEDTTDVMAAIEQEKRIKGWTRKKKYDLINQFNPGWRDLGDEVLGIENPEAS